jgi:hypothetical protein
MMSQDNVQNIITLVNSQIIMMNTYNTNVSRMMSNINTSVQDLIRLQEYIEMDYSLYRYYNHNRSIRTGLGRGLGVGNAGASATRSGNMPMSMHMSMSPRGGQTTINPLYNRRVRVQGRERGRGNTMNINPSNTRQTNTRQTNARQTNARQTNARQTNARQTNARQTNVNRTNSSNHGFWYNSQVGTEDDNSFNINRRQSALPTRRMTLQEFINTTMNYGNPNIPANNNQIMQETSITHYEDLSESDSIICPISLVPFDASSNILRINHCGHIFDAHFLRRWFRQDSRCPICRYNINSNIHNTGREANVGARGSGSVEEDIEENDLGEQVNDAGAEADGELDSGPEVGVGAGADGSDEANNRTNPTPNIIIYDISFSIPDLFGRDMSNGQINNVISNITDSITNSIMNTNLGTSGNIDLGAIVETVTLSNQTNSPFGAFEDDDDDDIVHEEVV